MSKKIWLSSPHIGKKELKFVQEAFDTNWIAPLGPNVTGIGVAQGNILYLYEFNIKFSFF